MKCYVLAVLWKDKALERDRHANHKVTENRGSKEILVHCGMSSKIYFWGEIYVKREQNLMSKPTETGNFGREHPLGLDILESDCTLHMHFHLPFKIPGTSFHPVLPIGICSPLIICHLEKLCLNSLCICPLLSVYLWCLNMVLHIRAALHLSTKTSPLQKYGPMPSPQKCISKVTSIVPGYKYALL